MNKKEKEACLKIKQKLFKQSDDLHKSIISKLDDRLINLKKEICFSLNDDWVKAFANKNINIIHMDSMWGNFGRSWISKSKIIQNLHKLDKIPKSFRTKKPLCKLYVKEYGIFLSFTPSKLPIFSSPTTISFITYTLNKRISFIKNFDGIYKLFRKNQQKQIQNQILKKIKNGYTFNKFIPEEIKPLALFT